MYSLYYYYLLINHLQLNFLVILIHLILLLLILSQVGLILRFLKILLSLSQINLWFVDLIWFIFFIIFLRFNQNLKALLCLHHQNRTFFPLSVFLFHLYILINIYHFSLFYLYHQEMIKSLLPFLLFQFI